MRQEYILFMQWYHRQENHNNDSTIEQIVDAYIDDENEEALYRDIGHIECDATESDIY